MKLWPRVLVPNSLKTEINIKKLRSSVSTFMVEFTYMVLVLGIHNSDLFGLGPTPVVLI